MERRGLRRISFLATLALALLALASFTSSGARAQESVIVPIADVNGSGVSGDASLTDNGDGSTTVDILVDGATGGHPAAIYAGSCAALGASAFTLTDVDASGESVTIVEAPLDDIVSGGPYAIGIQLAAGDTTSVACGDVPAGAAGGETVAAAEATPTVAATAEATPAAVGGTESVTDIGTSGVGTTFTGSTGFLVLAMGALGVMLLAGAFGIRRGDSRS